MTLNDTHRNPTVAAPFAARPILPGESAGRPGGETSRAANGAAATEGKALGSGSAETSRAANGAAATEGKARGSGSAETSRAANGAAATEGKAPGCGSAETSRAANGAAATEGEGSVSGSAETSRAANGAAATEGRALGSGSAETSRAANGAAATGLRAVAALLALAALLPGSPLLAQRNDSAAPVTLRLRVAEEIRPGRQAPQVVLPYATKDGLGPADQPFDLRKELGRVVVLAFYPGDFTPGCTAEWRGFRDRAETMFGPRVVVVGISADSLDSHVRFARELELPFKLLSDPKLVVARQYGATDGNRVKRVVVVIGRDGIIRYVDPAFAALDPQSYLQLGAAVEAARQEGSGG